MNLKEAQARIEELENENDELATRLNSLNDELTVTSQKLKDFQDKENIKRARRKARNQDPEVKAKRKARRLEKARLLKLGKLAATEILDDDDDDDEA